MKSVENNPSMGEKALESTAKVVETDGKADIYLSLKGLKFMNMYGHLLNLWAYPNGIESDLSKLVPAEITETRMDKGLTDEEKEFPSVFKISRDKTREKEIGVRVEVDAMEEIAKTSGQADGHQNARLVLDYSNLPGSIPEERVPNNNGYVNGYPGRQFRPDNQMLRCEAAKIMAKSLTEDYNESENYEKAFNDIEDDAWYKNVVYYMATKGVVKGSGDGKFYPMNKITRAEFVTMIVNILGKELDTDAQMNDIAGHWAEAKIKTAIADGWIKGYPSSDGGYDFKPDYNITRAEAVAIINRVKGLEINRSDIEANISNYFVPVDITNSHWAYYDVIMAIN